MNMRSYAKPKYWTVAVVIVMILSLAGCGGGGAKTNQPEVQAPKQATAEPTAEATTETSGTAEPVEIVVWYDVFEGTDKFYAYTKELFEKANPGVTVTFESHGWDEELRKNLVTAIETGTAPDIVVGENFFQEYAELGALVPIDDTIADIKDNLIPGTYKAAEYKGKVYGISVFTGVFGFERNCAVVEAAGLDCDKPPTTWAKLLEQAKTINEQGGDQYYGYTLQGPEGYSVGAAFRLGAYMAQAGAEICKDNCTYPYFNNPKIAPVMEFIRELNQYTPPGLTSNPDEEQVYMQLFQGRSAYQIAGSWHPDWAKTSGCEDCRYSSLPIPEGGNPASVIVGNTIYSVIIQSKHPKLAAEWVKLIASDEVQNRVYSDLGRLPSTRTALTKLRPDADSATQIFIDELLNNKELVILPQWRKSPNELWQTYNDMVAEVLKTDRPVQEIMDEAQVIADEIMQQ